MSPKSVLEPISCIAWLGKKIDGRDFSMQQTHTYIAQTLKGWLHLACCTYIEEHLRRVIGKTLWAATPGRQALPFLQGPMAWPIWGPPCAPYTPPRVLRSLCEALAVSVAPWWAPECIDPHHTWYADAAKFRYGYVAATWGPSLGCRIAILPHWVNSQQTAELMAIVNAVKLAAHMKLPTIHVEADNLAAIWSTIRMTGAVGNPWRGRALRRLGHVLRWGRLQMRLSYVRSKMNPTDHPSRIFEFQNHTVMHAQTWATCLVAKAQNKPQLVPMRWAATGG